MTLAEPTRFITLHALDLSIEKAAIQLGKRKSLKAKVTLDEATQTARLEVDRLLPAGEIGISLTYTGKINTALNGLHGEKVGDEQYMVTELEPADARRVLPCFDEPGFKAPFDVTLHISPSLTAVSNGRALEEKLEPGGKLKTVRFESSPPMATYLLTIAVGDFVSKSTRSATGIPVTLYALKSRAALLETSLQISADALTRLEKAFGIPYPYPKLDLIAVPQYQGAMENTAAILMVESLLVDPASTSTRQLQGAYDTIIHEEAHQWFGNLVTTLWWDDLWLNEAFATWMTTRILEEWKPEWRPTLEEAIKGRWIYRVDASPSTHAIRQPVHTAENAKDQFDGITYTKGSRILSWMEAWIGTELFWKGVTLYLQTHRDGNATADDFWRALATTSGQDILPVAQSWFDQPGFPLLSMQQRCEAGKMKVTLHQSRMQDRPTPETADAPLWRIPLPVTYALNNGDVSQLTLQQKTEWIRMDARDMMLEYPGCGWFWPNAEGQAFLQVHVDVSSRDALVKAMASGLGMIDRFALIDDLSAAVSAGLSPVEDFLELAELYRKETDRLLYAAPLSLMGWLRSTLLPEASRPRMEAHIKSFVLPHFERLGWDPRPNESNNESNDDAQQRAEVLGILGNLPGEKTMRDEARVRVRRHLDNPMAYPLPPEQRSMLLRLAAQEGDLGLWEAYLAKSRAEKNPNLRRAWQIALTAFREPVLLEKTLELALSPEVEGMSRGWMLVSAAGTQENRQQVWDWTKRHWERLTAVIPMAHRESLLYIPAGGCSPAFKEELTAWFSDPAHAIDDSSRAYQSSLERLDQCIRLKATVGPAAAVWLEKR